MQTRPQIGILQLYISTTCIMVAFAFQTFRIMAGLAKKKKCVEVARDAACRKRGTLVPRHASSQCARVGTPSVPFSHRASDVTVLVS